MTPETPKPEDVLEGVASLDTARMTLRWALERIHRLERSLAETQKELERSAAARQAAESGLRSAQERAKALARRERLLAEMESLMKDVFRGRVDLKALAERRQAFDEDRRAAEESVRRRFRRLEEEKDREVLKREARIARLERALKLATETLRRRLRRREEALARRHEEQLDAERRRFQRLREELLRENGLLQEQTDRRLLLLEREQSLWRRQIEDEYRRLSAEESGRKDAAIEELERRARGLQEKVREEAQRRSRDLEEAFRLMREELRGKELELRRQSDEDLRALSAYYEERGRAGLDAQAERDEARAREIASLRASLRAASAELEKLRARPESALGDPAGPSVVAPRTAGRGTEPAAWLLWAAAAAAAAALAAALSSLI